MPIYMDRHDVSEEVTAENVAQLHQADLKIQNEFGCRGLTYWFDEKRKTAFCLIEAPDSNAIKEMHSHAHGQVPHQIIEVEASIVESFLGRIEDPETAQNTSLNIINDPAFRTILASNIRFYSLKNFKSEAYKYFLTKYSNFLADVITRHKGRIVNQDETNLITAFVSVTDAVTCAFEIQTRFKMLLNEAGLDNIGLKIGLSSGIPVTEKKHIFEDTVNLAERMHHITRAEVVMTSEVKDLYKSENLNQFINVDKVVVLTSGDEHFLTNLIDFIEHECKNNALSVEDFNKHLGHSKSQLYRKMMTVIGESPNTLLMSIRLSMAVSLLNKQVGNISEIAYDSGFTSPAYFSKCFLKRYDILPSDYLRRIQI
jgi:AraC-like DNA-binding protein